MPMALESFDLMEYDLVISSESGPAKGVLVSAQARHICYCHTPMRYLWELYPDYVNRWTRSGLKRALMVPFSNYLRMWDYASAARVDEFIANSENVKRRIQRAYRREADVIYPPVAVESFFWREPRDYYLIVSELVSYKRLDVAIETFRSNRRKLKIVGSGPLYKQLQRRATPNIEFCGRVPASDLRDLYASCRALLLSGEEDFGITPVEALASGKPIIAWGRGGVLETAVIAGPGGAYLYATPDAPAMQEAIERFEAVQTPIPAERLQSVAAAFSEAEFLRKFQRVLNAPDQHEFVPVRTDGMVRRRMRM
jgi:glycosyltransferase involved in cell wall biosynthesis